MKDQKIQNYQVLKNEIDEIQTTLKNLHAKGSELAASLPRLKAAVVEAEQAKERALAGYVDGHASKGNVLESEKRLSEIKLELTTEIEIRDALNMKISETEGRLPSLQKKLQNARSEVYEIIGERLNADLSRLSDKINIAFAINRQTRLPRDRYHYFNDIFPENAGPDDIGEKLETLFEKEVA